MPKAVKSFQRQRVLRFHVIFLLVVLQLVLNTSCIEACNKHKKHNADTHADQSKNGGGGNDGAVVPSAGNEAKASEPSVDGMPYSSIGPSVPFGPRSAPPSSGAAPVSSAAPNAGAGSGLFSTDSKGGALTEAEAVPSGGGPLYPSNSAAHAAGGGGANQVPIDPSAGPGAPPSTAPTLPPRAPPASPQDDPRGMGAATGGTLFHAGTSAEGAAAPSAAPSSPTGDSGMSRTQPVANASLPPAGAAASAGDAAASPDAALTTPEHDAEDIEAATFSEDGGVEPVRRPTGPSYKNALHMPVDEATCQGSQALQLDRALTELAGMAELGLTSLLSSPLAPINQRYWGWAGEADLSIPVGLLTRLSGGNKTNVIIRCDGNMHVCTSDKVAAAEGGYVTTSLTPNAAGSSSANGNGNGALAALNPNVTTSVMLCPESFAGGKAARRWIEEVCLDEWTLSANNPTLFWPTALLSLLLQVPTLSSPLMQTPVHAYANALELARRDPLASTHSVYTYLYFLLDVFAQKHIKGGCIGQVSSRVNEGRR